MGVGLNLDFSPEEALLFTEIGRHVGQIPALGAVLGARVATPMCCSSEKNETPTFQKNENEKNDQKKTKKNETPTFHDDRKKRDTHLSRRLDAGPDPHVFDSIRENLF